MAPVASTLQSADDRVLGKGLQVSDGKGKLGFYGAVDGDAVGCGIQMGNWAVIAIVAFLCYESVLHVIFKLFMFR